MKFFNNKKINFIIFVILSAAISNLAYPKLNIFFIHFFSLVPLFYVLYNAKNIIESAFYGALWGMTFNLILLFWLKIFHPLAIPGLMIGFAFFYGLNFLIAKIFLKLFPQFRLITIPAIWTSIEYIRSIGFLGFPWGLLAHSQWNFLPFIQIAEIFGMWIISFIVVLINLLILEFLISHKKKFITIALILIAVPSFYGTIRILHLKKVILKSNTIRIALIQGNFDPRQNWEKVKYKILSDLTILSEKSALYKPDLIVWSESVVLDYLKYYIENEKRLSTYTNFIETLQYIKNVIRLPKDLGIPIFTGTLDFERELTKNGVVYKDYNAAVLISTNGKIVDVYHKNHLVPFGEWFPYGKYFPFIKKILEQTWAGNFTPSNRQTVFNMEKFRFGALICYEGIFGYLVRLFALKGVELLINITNDMWSYSERAEYQHMIADIYRCIENRVPYVRAANSGVTCYINLYGKVEKIAPLFKQTYLIVDVPIRKSYNLTFYTLYGDYFPKILIVGLILLFILRLLYEYLVKTKES